MYLQQGAKVHCTNDLLVSCCHTTLCCTLWHLFELNFLESLPRPSQQLASFLFLFYFCSRPKTSYDNCLLHAASDRSGLEKRTRGATVSDDLWGVCLSICLCLSVCLSVWWFSGVSVCSCQTMWRRLVCSVLSVRVLPQCDIVFAILVVVVVAVTNVVISTQLLSVLPSLLCPCQPVCLSIAVSAYETTNKTNKTQTNIQAGTHTLSIPGQETSEGRLRCSLLNKKEK